MEYSKQNEDVKGFNKFVIQMHTQYNLSHDEIMRAAAVFGEHKSKLWAYCVVQHSLRNKGLPIEDARNSIVNRWFPHNFSPDNNKQ